MSLFALATSFTLPAQAQTVTTIQDGQTLNGQQVLDGDDTLTVEEGGALTVTGDNAVSATGENNTIVNDGSISADGDGINSEIDPGSPTINDNLTIINNGSIIVDGDGVRSEGDDLSITNEGSINAGEDGIRSEGDDLIVTNRGSINAGRDGIRSQSAIEGGNAIIINEGSINAGDDGIRSEGANATITNEGNITSGGEAIDSVGSDARITNNGSIVTNDTNAQGIDSDGNRSIVINNGTITTLGGGASGIDSNGEFNIIVNNGIILTLNDTAEGINTSGNASEITNNGSIVTNGDESEGIRTSSNNVNLINNGTVTANGNLSEAIDASGDNSNVINIGTVIATGESSDGILTRGANGNIINSGSVSATGANSIAVSLDDEGVNNSTLTNSGLIVASGDTSQAIVGGDGQQTVNIEQGSVIFGIVDLGGGTDVANINGTGPTITVTFENTETIDLADSVAGVVIGNTVSTLDRAAHDLVGTAVNALSVAIHGTLNRRAPDRPSSPLFAAPDFPASAWAPSEQAALEPAADAALRPQLYDGDTQIWGAALGGRLERDGSGTSLPLEHDYRGVVAGIERDVSFGRYGVALGIADSVSQNDGQTIETDTRSVFGGVYGHTDLTDRFTLRTSLIVGYETYDHDRLVADNLNGFETAVSDYSGIVISPSVALDYDRELSNGFHLRATGSLVYTASLLESYSETGTTRSNFDFDERAIQTLNARAQIAGAYVREGVDIEVRAGLDGRLILEDEVEASLAGTTFQFAASEEETILGGFIGLNAYIAASEHIHLVGDVELRTATGGETEVSGHFQTVFEF
ncbi:MAG: autotransporter domain-containing protein [Pseudomonadota bacterium]